MSVEVKTTSQKVEEALKNESIEQQFYRVLTPLSQVDNS
jgi:hypothetical protein